MSEWSWWLDFEVDAAFDDCWVVFLFHFHLLPFFFFLELVVVGWGGGGIEQWPITLCCFKNTKKWIIYFRFEHRCWRRYKYINVCIDTHTHTQGSIFCNMFRCYLFVCLMSCTLLFLEFTPTFLWMNVKYIIYGKSETLMSNEIMANTQISNSFQLHCTRHWRFCLWNVW